VSITNFEQHNIGTNDEIILPPVALVTTIETKALACDKFFLPGLPKHMGTPIKIMDSTNLSEVEQELIDLQNKINDHSKWEKLPYIPPNMKNLIHFITST
jgi:hypothetical protein